MTQEKNTNSELSFDNTKIAFKHQTDQQLKESYWLFKLISNNFLVKIGPSFTKFALWAGLPIKKAIKATIFKQFCGGETIDECNSTINNLSNFGVGTILDYSVEGEEEELVFDATAHEIIQTIKKSIQQPDKIPFCVFKITGVARFLLLEKLSNKEPLQDFEKLEWEKALRRIYNICETAFNADVKVMIDAEESWIQNIIDEVALEMMLKFNQQKAIVFNTYQLYRHDKFASLVADCTMAKNQHFILGAKLVRGAYMEKERKRAEDKGYPSPIQPTKQATDQDFNKAVSYCLENIENISFVAGTHNQQSCELLVNQINNLNLITNHHHIYFSQLLGMSDNLSFNLAAANFNVAKYVPYGPVKAVLPYLIRRANENTAVAGQMGRELRLISTELKRRKNS